MIATFLGLFLGLIVISACVFLAACGFGIVRRDVIGIYAISVLMVWAVSWFELLARFPVSEFQPSRYLRMHVTRSIAVLVGTAAGAVLTKDAAWTAIGAAAGMFASSFSVRPPLMWPRRSNFDRELARDVIVFGFPLAVSMAIASIIDGGSRLLLAFLDSAQALASYTAASILVQTAIGFIGMAVYTAGYSRVVIAVERDEHAAAQQQLLANGALLLAVLAPASLGLALVGESLATIFVGPQLVPGVVAVIPWIAASTFLGAIRAYHLDQAFQLGKRPQLQVWMQLLGGATSVALCFYLIPDQRRSWSCHGSSRRDPSFKRLRRDYGAICLSCTFALSSWRTHRCVLRDFGGGCPSPPRHRLAGACTAHRARCPKLWTSSVRP